MNKPPDQPLAWVVAVNMGYGHQRTAYPLRGLAPDGRVLLANNYPGMPDRDRAIWARTWRFYELVSNLQRVPVVGSTLFGTFDIVQRIWGFYPRRDLSRPDWRVKALYALIESGWGRDLIERLAQRTPVLPIVASFFTPAFMAEHYGYPGDIYCTICDADIARAWAPLSPATSRIRYFAPNRRVAERLGLYGIRTANIYTTGYPLPLENVGDERLSVLRADLVRRLARLDPERSYSQRYAALIGEKLGSLPPPDDRPLTLLFSVGGAGAQKEMVAAYLHSLRPSLAEGGVRAILSAGVRRHVRAYLLRELQRLGLTARPDGPVEILWADTIEEYFRQFNLALRTTDVLWTKPSELSFYAGLGLPIVLAPPLGSQEWANREWLLQLGAAMTQHDPRYAGEWLIDVWRSGWFAEAAMQGFIECDQLGAEAIRSTIATVSHHALVS